MPLHISFLFDRIYFPCIIHVKEDMDMLALRHVHIIYQNKEKGVDLDAI